LIVGDLVAGVGHLRLIADVLPAHRDHAELNKAPSCRQRTGRAADASLLLERPVAQVNMVASEDLG